MTGPDALAAALNIHLQLCVCWGAESPDGPCLTHQAIAARMMKAYEEGFKAALREAMAWL